MLNGGLGEVNPIFWLALLLGFAALENGTLDYQFSGWQSSGKHWTSNPNPNLNPNPNPLPQPRP